MLNLECERKILMTVYDTNCEFCNKHYVTGDDPTVEDSGLCNECENNEHIEFDDDLHKFVLKQL